MLTAKHITADGTELIIEAIRVIVERSKIISPPPKNPDRVIVIEPDGHKEVFDNGTVYIMNETGATVSQWFTTK
jgi:hypothetical protein